MKDIIPDIWTLQRDDYYANGVWGTLVAPSGLTLQTLENPDHMIRTGTFLCHRDYWFGGQLETFEIEYPDMDGNERPDRDRLLFHPGNFAHQSRGCPLLGMERYFADGFVPAITRSRHAHSLYMEELRGIERHWLQVLDGDRFMQRLADD